VGAQLNITPHIHYDAHLSDMAKGSTIFSAKVLAAAKIFTENLSFQLERCPGAPKASDIYQEIAADLREGTQPHDVHLLMSGDNIA
jgi:hypothetical protein